MNKLSLSKTEQDFLMNSIANGDTYKMVSERLQKDENELKCIVLEIVKNLIYEKKGLPEYYCNEYNISKQELYDFMQEDN